MRLIKPKGIIIHSMAEYIRMPTGDAMYAKDYLAGINLSAHVLIRPDGEIDQMINPPHKALHAGKSFHNGYKNLNNHYLGIELLVAGIHNYSSFKKAIKEYETYTYNQIQAAIELCAIWINTYGIPLQNIARHSDVSGDDIRGKGFGKIDPGSAFDWENFITLLTRGQD